MLELLVYLRHLDPIQTDIVVAAFKVLYRMGLVTLKERKLVDIAEHLV